MRSAMNSFCICSWLLIVTATLTVQQQCSVTNLPVFKDSKELDSFLGKPTKDRLQAIVPALSFTCTGRVTEWRACVEQGGDMERYYIQFQVWRSTGAQGCYTLVGYNAPPLSEGAVDVSLLLVPSGRCVVLQVAENEQIEFQPDDVIGYYADRHKVNKDPNDGGVQVIEDNNVVVYHIVDVPLSDLKTEYAISPLGPDPAACGFNIADSTSTLHDLTMSTSGAPIITVTLVTVINSTTSSLSPSSTVGVVISSPTILILTSTPPAEVTSSRSSVLARNGMSSQAQMESSSFPTSPPPPSSSSFPFSSPSPSSSSVSISFSSSSSSSSSSSTASSAVSAPEPSIAQSEVSSNQGGLSAGVVAAIVLVILISLLVAAFVAFVLLFLRRRRKKNASTFKNSNDITNPTYDKGVKLDSFKQAHPDDSNGIYSNPEETSHYEDTMELYACPDVPGNYEMPQNTLERFGEWSIYVPTEQQRGLYQTLDDIYAQPLTSADKNNGDGNNSVSFFEESDIYWEPASSPAELYEQLAKYRFREIQRHLIQTVEHLGSGQFGTVEKGVWKCPRGEEEVAIKLLKSGASDEDRVKFLQEAAIMGQFRHPNVVKLHGVVTLGDPVMIVMELVKNGDLRKYLINLRPIPGEMVPDTLSPQLLDFCHQICAGMRYLSDKGFVHRDIAARNILVSGKVCKIADFGMARNLQDSDYYTSHGGQIPIKWTAPEALQYKKYSTASDVWSFGCLMYEIWSLGYKPFEGHTNSQSLRRVLTGWRLPPPPGCPREMYQLMILCWHQTASSRPLFGQILQVLSQSEHELLSIPEEEGRVHPQASFLGASLEAGKDLYLQLQESYSSSKYTED